MSSRGYDPERIIACETGAETLQWEAAERIHAGVQSGISKSQVARDISKHESHVRFCYKVWDSYLGTKPEDRPPFNDAYQAAKGGNGGGAGGGNEEYEWDPARYLLEAQVKYNGMVDSINQVIKFYDDCDEARTGIADMFNTLAQHVERARKHVR